MYVGFEDFPGSWLRYEAEVCISEGLTSRVKNFSGGQGVESELPAQNRKLGLPDSR